MQGISHFFWLYLSSVWMGRSWALYCLHYIQDPCGQMHGPESEVSITLPFHLLLPTVWRAGGGEEELNSCKMWAHLGGQLRRKCKSGAAGAGNFVCGFDTCHDIRVGVRLGEA